MSCDRGTNFCYNDNHITIYKCIKLTCCTFYIYSVICQIYLNKKKTERNKNAYRFFFWMVYG